MGQCELLNKIKEADIAYYDNDNPIMSDIEYDKLRNEYQSKYGSLDYVPGNVKKELKPFTHTYNINSLDKIKYFEEDKLRKTIKLLMPVVIEPKYDGLTVVAYGNKFVTRGKGSIGEILPRFPRRYSENSSEYPIRGEAYITKKDFQYINEQQKQKNLPLFANPRNACAGLLRRLEDNPYLDFIQYIAYDVIGLDITETAKIKYIKNHTNFDVTGYMVHEDNDIESVITNIQSIYNELINSDLPIDGIVVKSNQENSLKKFGSTEHHPLNAFAYKAEEEIAQTVLKNIEWQIGRETLTPVAIFDTVILDGTEVSKASLSNLSIMKSFNFKIGDTISVFKSNQIIPQILERISSNGGNDIVIPTHCPSCNAELTIRKNNNTEELICTNELCKGKLANRIVYMFSKSCLNATGVSIQTVTKLIHNGFINKPTDMFHITKDNLLSIDGFKDKSATNFIMSITNSKENVPLTTFIASIGFIGIGLEVGKLLSVKYKTYDNLVNALKEKKKNELINIKGIGLTTLEKLLSIEFINEMEELHKYVKIKEDTIVINENQRIFVITGKLSKSRKFFVAMIESHGDKVVDSISSNTTYLVLNDKDSTSTKAKNARKLNIPIINEKELIELFIK